MSTNLAFRDGGKTSEAGASRLISKNYTRDGVLGTNDLAVTQQITPGASVLVGVGDIIIGKNSPYSVTKPDYFYHAWVSVAETVNIAANSSGNPRIDSIVGYIDLAVVSSATNDNPGVLKFIAVQGTAAATPSAPSDSTIQSAVGGVNPWVLIAQVAVANGFSSITNANITDTRPNADTKQKIVDDITQDFVVSGLVVSQNSGLVGTISTGQAYIQGVLVEKPAISKTFTATKDTYIDLPNTAKPTTNVDYTYTEVTVGAAAPALTAGSIRLAKVTTNGSAITSIVQSGVDSLSNKIRNTDPVSVSSLGGSDGWKAVTDTWTFSSQDGPTFVATVPTDATANYYPGMRVKVDQSVALSASYNLDSNSTDQKSGLNGTDTSITYTSGKFNNAATFNGTTSKIVIADNAVFKPTTGAFTLGMWFKTSSTGTNKFLFQSKSGATPAGFQLYVDASNHLVIVMGNGTVSAGIGGATNVADNNWHQVVFSYQNGIAQIYLDGVLECFRNMPTVSYAGTNYVRIGAESQAGTDSTFWSGQIDDVYVVNGWAAPEDWVLAKYTAQSAQGTANITFTSKFITTSVAPTAITMFGGTDYSLLNSTISNIYTSISRFPQGFPAKRGKWTVRIVDDTERSQASPSNNVWYNLGGTSITVPIGDWNLSYNVCPYCSTSGSTNFRGIATLSTLNNAETDYQFTSGFTTYSASTGAGSTTSKDKDITLSSKTTFYLNTLAQAGLTLGTLFNENSDRPAVLKAVSNLY